MALQAWTCPVCGAVREAFAQPHHSHDGTWVPFAGADDPLKVKPRRPRRPRTTSAG